VGPAQLDGFPGIFAIEQAIEKARRVAIAAADAVKHVQLASGRGVGLAVDPCNRAPAMAVGGMNLAQGGGDDLDLRMLLDDLVYHPQEGARVKPVPGGHRGAGDAQPQLQVLFIADQHVHLPHNPIENFHRAVMAAGNVP